MPKISALPEASSATDASLLAVVVGGTTKKIQKKNLLDRVVASYYGASETDLSSVPELNGVFYTVPSGQAGLYRLSVAFTTPGPFVVGVDQAQVSAYLNGPPDLNSILIQEPSRLYQGGEGTQAALTYNRPADLLLNDGDTVQLSSYSGGVVSVLVRLERLEDADDL